LGVARSPFWHDANTLSAETPNRDLRSLALGISLLAKASSRTGGKNDQMMESFP
jgi:hypothetical protein